jgi:ABC-type phosphate/phosphonate transport system substrate-binding protein
MPTLTGEWGMYPFASVRWAWDALWEGITERVDWVPRRLAHSGDVHARWDDPECVVNHVCGWPLARWYTDSHRVVGAFSLTIPEADGPRYRSTLVSPHDVELDGLIAADVRAVANSVDSLSGWISFLHATVGAHDAWPGPVTFSGAHLESLRALADGTADIACIDSWTLAILGREQPALIDGLHRLGHGPWIPSPAVTVRADVARADVGQLRQALIDALAGPEAAAIREALFVDGFEPLSIDDYLPVLDLRRDPA